MTVTAAPDRGEGGSVGHPDKAERAKERRFPGEDGGRRDAKDTEEEI